MKIYSLETGNFMCDGGAMFSVVPKAYWSRKYKCNEDNNCNCALRCLLIIDGDKKILVDTGTGNKQSEEYFAGQHLNGTDTLDKSLAEIGLSSTDITDVILTHLHFDHCGGAVKKNKETGDLFLAFGNAQYWVSKTQWDNFNNPNVREADAYLKENIIPVFESGKLNFINKNCELFPGIELRLFNGHTFGLMLPFIKIEDATVVFCGDFIPTAVNLPVKWLASYDINPLDSLDEKASFLKEAVENNYTLFFQHDIDTQACNLQNTPRGIKIKNKFRI